MKISIIIPVFNEEKTIKQILHLIRETRLVKGLTKEVIVVDDASNDKTSKIIKGYNHQLKYFRQSSNKGKGAAVRLGLQNASGEIIIIQDADLEYNPNDYSKLLLPILNGETKVVYGTRLKNYPLKFWGERKTVLPLNLIANRFLTFLTNILYNSHLTDMETCYKIFTRKLLEDIKLRANKFDFEPEITAKFLKRGYKIKEVPIVTQPRSYKEGKKIGWSDGVYAIWTLIKYRFVN